MAWFKGSQEKKQSQETKPRTAFCSFCRRDYREVGPLVEGPNNVYICTECNQICTGILQQEQNRRGGKIKGFLITGATYRFTMETTTCTGVVCARLPNPDNHWIQVDPINKIGEATLEPTWINLFHEHTITEVTPGETPPSESSPLTSTDITSFRPGTK